MMVTAPPWAGIRGATRKGDTMDATRPDLAAVRRALDAARVSLADGSRDGAGGRPPDPVALATAVGQLIGAVEGLADLLEAANGQAGKVGNTGVVDEHMPAAGPKFDRSRPHRGYRRGE